MNNGKTTILRGATGRTMLVAVAGLSLAGSLAGCAPSAQGTSAAGNDAPGGPGQKSSGSYKDGTFSADGHYLSPNGNETIGVTVTLANNVVKDLQLTPHPTNPNTRRFQSEFIGGVNAKVVGKNIDSLNVSKVAGSSLTSGGFNDALTQIKKEATK
ncbi:MAG: hypothetical protein M3017_04835 [Actinomycetota bacterium]|nr:hypothetical protein [Actinomycetota bacterium]